MRLVPARIGYTAQGFFQSSPFATRRGLGQDTEQTWYARAKAAVAKFDDLVVHFDALPAAYRERVDYSIPLKKAIRDRVQSFIAGAENRLPADFGSFSSLSLQDDIVALETANKSIEDDIKKGASFVPPPSKPEGPLVSGDTVKGLALGGILVVITGLAVFLDT